MNHFYFFFLTELTWLGLPLLPCWISAAQVSKFVLILKTCLVLHMRMLMKISRMDSLLCSSPRPSKSFYIIYNYINLRMPLWISVWVTVLSWPAEVLTSKENGVGLFLTAMVTMSFICDCRTRKCFNPHKHDYSSAHFVEENTEAWYHKESQGANWIMSQNLSDQRVHTGSGRNQFSVWIAPGLPSFLLSRLLHFSVLTFCNIYECCFLTRGNQDY